jgi:hypothetical protein
MAGLSGVRCAHVGDPIALIAARLGEQIKKAIIGACPGAFVARAACLSSLTFKRTFMHIRNISLVALATLVVAGCASHSEARSKAPVSDEEEESRVVVLAPQEVPKDMYPTDNIVSDQRIMFAGAQHAYYVGRLVDRNNPNIMREAGVVYRQEQSPRWNTNPSTTPDPADATTGPNVTEYHPAFHPGPTVADRDQRLSKAMQLIEVLTATNKALLAKVEDMESAGAGADGAATERETGVIVVKASPDVEQAGADGAAAKRSNNRLGLTILRPNSENTIELDPAFFVPPAESSDNPFVQVYSPKIALQELDLIVSAAMPGEVGAAVLNGQPYTVGESIKGLTLYDVDIETIYLRKDMFLLACPVSSKPVKLRIP